MALSNSQQTPSKVDECKLPTTHSLSIVMPAHNEEVAIAETLHAVVDAVSRSEEHTSELQSHSDLVCRLLLEKKNTWTDHLSQTATSGKTTPTRCARQRT